MSHKVHTRLLSAMPIFLTVSCSAATDTQNYLPRLDKLESLTVKNPASGSALPQWVSIDIKAEESSSAHPLPSLFAQAFPSYWQRLDNGMLRFSILMDMPPNHTTAVSLSPTSPFTEDRAHAELSVRTGGQWEGSKYKAEGFDFAPVDSFIAPPQLTDHSYYLRYEGPGWENDLIAYRLYLDWRNGTDVFVKTGPCITLPQVGQDGYDSYHVLAPWGGDALKVGKSLGLGSMGRYHDEGVARMQSVAQTGWQLTHNDSLHAGFIVTYKGWSVGDERIDLNLDYRIRAGDPATSVTWKSSSPVANMVTGIVKHQGMTVIDLQQEEWAVMATYGKQNLLGEDESLGLALFYRRASVSRRFEGEHDHLIQFALSSSADYEFMATWPGHPSSPQSMQAFIGLLTEKLGVLNHPAVVTAE